MGFVKKTLTCLGCKAPLGKSKSGSSECADYEALAWLKALIDTAVCKNCEKRTAELYQKQVSRILHREALLLIIY